MKNTTFANVAGALIVALLLSMDTRRSDGSEPRNNNTGIGDTRTVSFGGDEPGNAQKPNDGVAFACSQEVVFKLVRRIEWPGNHVFVTAFSSDGKRYLGGGDTGTLRVWEVETGDQLIELPVLAGVFMPDGKSVLGHKFEKAIELFDVASGRVVRRWEASEPIVSLAIAPDGKLAVTGHADGVLRVWDVASGEELRKLEGHFDPPNVVFAPDGKLILSACKDKTVRLWEAQTGKLVLTFDDFKDATPNEGTDLIVQAFFLPGGRQLAAYVWGTNKTLLVLNAADGTVVRKLDLGMDVHKEVAVSPDGRWVVTAHDDQTVRLRDLTTGKEIQRLDVTDTNVARALNFSRDGRFIVAGTWRSWVYLWRLQN